MSLSTSQYTSPSLCISLSLSLSLFPIFISLYLPYLIKLLTFQHILTFLHSILLNIFSHFLTGKSTKKIR
jgi:hypothetical protein